MKRREFIVLVGTAVITGSRAGSAQTPGKVYRSALVSPGGLLPKSAPFAKLLLGGLAKLGYTPGQNLAFEAPHGAAGQPVRLAHLMEELKAAKVDVIVVFGYPAAVAAKAATIPTVVAFG